jgi:hypothetical protein
MKKWAILLLVVVTLMLLTVSFVNASGDPVGGCPDGFQLHMTMDHNHDHDGPHQHAGNDRDLNGDGWICGKHVGANGSVHVHIDNNVPLP